MSQTFDPEQTLSVGPAKQRAIVEHAFFEAFSDDTTLVGRDSLPVMAMIPSVRLSSSPPPRPSPSAIEAARLRRAARRMAAADATRMRWIVTGIWVIAISLMGTLTVMASPL
jgi:hypothetical protein